MTILAICPTKNSHGKKDVTGAFLPEARRFVERHGGKLVQFDNGMSKPYCRAAVERAIWETHSELLTCLAIFCHGWKTGIQTGHTKASIKSLAEVIALRSSPDVAIALYACDTARDSDAERADDVLPGPGGEGGFADALRDALVAAGCRGGHVDAHSVTAHTTRAPYLRRFHISPEAKDSGGDWIVAPGSPQWARWKRALWSKVEPKDIRLDFPFLTVEEVRASLPA